MEDASAEDKDGMRGRSHNCFLIGLSFLIGLAPIRTIRTINRLLIGLIVHIIVQHKAGLYKYISYIYGIYIIYYIFIYYTSSIKTIFLVS